MVFKPPENHGVHTAPNSIEEDAIVGVAVTRYTDVD